MKAPFCIAIYATFFATAGIATEVSAHENARAEVRHVQKPRARGLEQNAAGQAQPIQDARAQEQPAAAPSFLQSLGMHQ